MHRIESPRTDDSAIEQEIQAKGLTAPRITPAEIELAISSQWYFTADEGVIGDRWRFAEDDDVHDNDIPPPLHLLTFCVLVLSNGFTVTGQSACASSENFDAEIGRKVARANAVQQCWPLLGYALKERLACAGQNDEPVTGESTVPPHQQRVIAEKMQLDERLGKLRAFFGTDTYRALDVGEKSRLASQVCLMADYSSILASRIEAFTRA